MAFGHLGYYRYFCVRFRVMELLFKKAALSTKYTISDKMNKAIFVFLFFLCGTVSLYSQDAKTYTISGVIRDASTGDVLIGANVQDLASGKGITTDINGRYA